MATPLQYETPEAVVRASAAIFFGKHGGKLAENFDITSHRYDPSAFMKNLCLLHRTVIPSVMASPLFWILLGFAILFQTVFHFLLTTDLQNNLPRFNDNTMLGTSSFVVFFSVFYANRAYIRYFEQYKYARLLITSVHNLTHASMGLMSQRQDYVQHICRYAHAMHFLGYITLMRENVETEMEVTKATQGCLDHLYHLRILTQAEVYELKQIRDITAHRRVSVWMLWLLNKAQKEGLLAPPVFSNLMGLALRLQSDLMQLESFSLEPIPFAYYHFLNLLMSLYGPLLSWEMMFRMKGGATYGVFLAVPMYIVILLVLLGLRNLAAHMSDPFGIDEVDFPIHLFVTSPYLEHREHLGYHSQPPGWEGTS
eukprot:CAMPEP_0175129344 /NCGR_PEP_ID=MMETSP0087-20121206/5416_1 /TAXON_ID=136419 /ORGANISM="Unknown Unknown, Strain D1" /LENGTH=367 /DNA_ID=CAMNT_0016411475 /DNA_START=78 /DNA_END=1181 /DNA_ORIENTATION=-